MQVQSALQEPWQQALPGWAGWLCVGCCFSAAYTLAGALSWLVHAVSYKPYLRRTQCVNCIVIWASSVDVIRSVFDSSGGADHNKENVGFSRWLHARSRNFRLQPCVWKFLNHITVRYTVTSGVMQCAQPTYYFVDLCLSKTCCL